MSRTKLRLLLADDHEDVLREVAKLLVGEFEIVGTAKDGAALLSAAAKLRPDVVVTDLKMPRIDGIEAGRQLLAQQFSKAVVLLTMYGDPDTVRVALKSGIRGFVLKFRAGEDLISAIHSVAKGRTFISSDITLATSTPLQGKDSEPHLITAEISGDAPSLKQAQSAVPKVPLGIGDAYVNVGAHLLLLWENEAEFRTSSGFFAAGVAAGDHFLLIGNSAANETVKRFLEQENLDTVRLAAEGRLTTLNMDVPNLAVGLAAIQDAIGRGAPLVRVLGTVAGSQGGNQQDEDAAIAAERETDGLIQLFPVILVCPYNINGVSGRSIVKAALEHHPLVIHGNSVAANPFYHVS